MILQMVHFSDGTKVADLLVSALKTQWLTGHPSLAQGPCVALRRWYLVTTPCDNSKGSYFDSGNAANTTKTMLGYLCEAREPCHKTLNGKNARFIIRARHIESLYY